MAARPSSHRSWAFLSLLCMQLLARRMKAAELLEKQEAVLQGLQLLYRRLVGQQCKL